MPTWCFPRALDDEGAYHMAQRHWRDVFERLRARLEGRGWATPWPAEDLLGGNPIFIAESKTEGRSFRIIQLAPGDPDDADLVTWVEKIHSPASNSTLTELVVACCPSVENRKLIETILHTWMRKGELDASPPKPLALGLDSFDSTWTISNGGVLPRFPTTMAMR